MRTKECVPFRIRLVCSDTNVYSVIGLVEGYDSSPSKWFPHALKKLLSSLALHGRDR
jgi:hypothetical protein